MESQETTPNDDKHARILSALGYLPVTMIHILIPLYVLITKEGGKFAKFHAIQSLAFYAALMLVNGILAIPYMLVFGYVYLGMFSGFGSGAGAEIFKSMGLIFVAIIPMLLVSAAYTLGSLYLAYSAFQGRKVMLPFIGRKVMEHI